MPDMQDLDKQYLEAVLARLDARLGLFVRLWHADGQDPDDRFRGLYTRPEEAAQLLGRKPGSHRGSGHELSEKESQELHEAEQKALESIKSIEEQAKAAGFSLKLQSLRNIFHLSEFEWWALIVVLAPSLDLRYETIYGFLQDDVTRKTASIHLVLNILGKEGLSGLDSLRYFQNNSPLIKSRLLLPVEDTGSEASLLRKAYRISPSMITWLLSEYQPGASYNGRAEYFPPKPETTQEDETIFFDANIPPPEVFENIRPLVSIIGNDILQHEAAARRLANALQKPLLVISLEGSENTEFNLAAIQNAVRDCRLLDAWLYIKGADAIINSSMYLERKVFEDLQLLNNCVLMSSNTPIKLDPAYPDCDYPVFYIPFNEMTSLERQDMWSSLLDDISMSIAEEEISILAGQFSLTSGQILASVSTALGYALQQKRGLESADLFRAAQFHSGHQLEELAQKITPRYTWNDLVLPETPINMLQEMVQMVQARPVVLEKWGLGKKLASSKGISALFAGPPGTGKTLSAQIIANELGIDLFRIDLSTVVSKYVGETEKNLEKIFTEASRSNAILFFDEADAIFGKRSEVKDAQDRYANLEVGYLLQRMESYDGLAILATNLKANLDDAFTRRLQFIINFPFPDEEYRLRIWKVLIPESLPVDENLDLNLMAKTFKLAGGNIRNIIMSAAYYAAENGNKVTMPHLMHGARREIQKMGKLVNESDFNLP